MRIFDFPTWTQDALCAQTDPEVFFPAGGSSDKPAKAICSHCPVAAECLDYALARESVDSGVGHLTHGPFGVYGGLNARERRSLRRLLNPTTGPSEPTQESA